MLCLGVALPAGTFSLPRPSDPLPVLFQVQEERDCCSRSLCGLPLLRDELRRDCLQQEDRCHLQSRQGGPAHLDEAGRRWLPSRPLSGGAERGHSHSRGGGGCRRPQTVLVRTHCFWACVLGRAPYGACLRRGSLWDCSGRRPAAAALQPSPWHRLLSTPGPPPRACRGRTGRASCVLCTLRTPPGCPIRVKRDHLLTGSSSRAHILFILSSPRILKSCEYPVYRRMWVPMEPPCQGPNR